MAQWKPSVGQPTNPPEDPIIPTTQPEWNRSLNRQGIDPGAVDLVPLPAIVHDRRCPERPKNLDLLLDPRAPIAKILIQSLKLDVVPADANAQSQPPAGQDVDRGDLFRHEGSLALRKNDHPGH